MAKQFIKVEADSFTPAVSDGLLVSQFPYGWQVHEGPYSEWAVTVLFTGRQDGKVSWLATLTDVDGLVRHAGGLDKWDVATCRIEAAIGRLSVEAGWIDPLNGGGGDA